ncbi:DinB family protein [Nocardioides nanhaiensis]|uniref:DinB family protein n=1 Tax=Nocardioides nanhaiensis TaxID=1476871 RepID=A0ABP8VS15_9ACTN
MTTYSDTDDFQGATFFDLSMRGAAIRQADVRGMTMRGVFLDGLDVDSHDLAFGTLLVNGVDVVPLVEAELDRRYPGRELRSAQTPEGLHEAWMAVQDAWAEMMASTPPERADEHVRDEWSLAQTLRHLVLATDTWLRKSILDVDQPFHEIGQIFDGAEEAGFDCSIFRTGPIPYAEVLEVRAERQQMVTDFLAGVAPEQLAEERADPWGGPDGDWSPTVGDCVRVILEEEWAHLRYIQRDLALLSTARG